MLPGRNSGRTGLPCSNPDFRRPGSRIPARRVLGRLGDRRPGEGDGSGRKRTFQPMQLVPVFRNAFLALRRFDDGFRPSGLCERQAGGRTNGQAGGIRQATEIVEGLPNPIVKNSMIDVIERPGMGVDLIPEAAAQYLAPEDVGFFD